MESPGTQASKPRRSRHLIRGLFIEGDMSRFDYVQYDDHAAETQNDFKKKFIELDNLISATLKDGCAKSLVLTKLEEAYMWCGKAIRDEQISRNGSAELQENRCDS